MFISYFAVLDAGIRIPRGILMGNVLDMGNYYQCIRINENIPNSIIEGKYCSISVPLDFWYSLTMLAGSSEFLWRDADPNKFPLDKDMLYRIKMFRELKEGFNMNRKIASRYVYVPI